MKKIMVKILVKIEDDKIAIKEIPGYILDYDKNLAIHRDYSHDKYWTITDIKTGLLVFSKFGLMTDMVDDFKTHVIQNKYVKFKQSPKYKEAINFFNKVLGEELE